MSSIKVNICGAERLGEIFDIAIEEAQAARSAGIPVEVAQQRGVVDGAIIVTIVTMAEPYVKEFLVKFFGRIAQNLADRLTSRKAVEPFDIVLNDTRYRLPDDLERLRHERGVA